MAIIPESLPHLRFEVPEAARILRISRATLYERIRRGVGTPVPVSEIAPRLLAGWREHLIRRRKPRAIDVGMRPLTLGVTDGIV
jgi:hypothetical protein